ncbi:MAG TPA: hypothetical protein VF475_00675 [Sphingobium sp.]
MRTPLLLISVLLLSACATPQAQLATGLSNAGLPKPLSQCMAKDMTPRLSIKQLLRLRDLSHVSDRDPRKTSIDRYLHQVRALGDSEIWTVASSAATRCALGW